MPHRIGVRVGGPKDACEFKALFKALNAEESCLQAQQEHARAQSRLQNLGQRGLRGCGSHKMVGASKIIRLLLLHLKTILPGAKPSATLDRNLNNG